MLNLILTMIVGLSATLRERVDLIELNHFHDENGKAVYDQVIFYEWSASQAKYHVRAWCLVEPKDVVSKRPIWQESDQSWHVRWHDTNDFADRHIASKLFRETWTQVDPERANKKILDERNRVALIKKNEPIPSPELPAQ